MKCRMLACGLLLLLTPTAWSQTTPRGQGATPPDAGASAVEDVPLAERLIETALTPLPEAPLAGKPVALLAVLDRVGGDPRLRQDATLAYWELSRAIAEYYALAAQAAYLDELAKPAEQSRLIKSEIERSALYSIVHTAKALEGEAQVAVTAAQQDLARQMGWPASDEPPLPQDLPHVGSYATRFSTIFARRSPPWKAVLLRDTLPLVRDAVDARADAWQAAHDAFEASDEAFRQGTVSLDTLLNSLAELVRQRMAYVQSVHRYNTNILDYAMIATGGRLAKDQFVSMLIRSRSNPSRAGWEPDSGAVPAAFEDPIEEETIPPGEAATWRSANRQDLRRTDDSGDQPARGAGGFRMQPRGGNPASAPPPAGAGGAAGNSGAGNSGAGNSGAGNGAAGNSGTPRSGTGASADDRGRVAVPRNFTGPSASLVHKDTLPQTAVAQAPAAESDPLVTVIDYYIAPEEPTAAPPAKERISLGECLRSASRDRWREVIAGYWECVFLQGRQNAYRDQVAQAEELAKSMVPTARAADGAGKVLRLAANQRAMEAELAELRANLVAARLRLAAASGLTNLPTGWQASEKPKLPTASAMSATASAAGSRSPSAQLDKLHQALVDRADAVLDGGETVALLQEDLATGRADIDTVLLWNRRHTHDTNDLLRKAETYCNVLAESALASGRAASPDELAATLAVRK